MMWLDRTRKHHGSNKAADLDIRDIRGGSLKSDLTSLFHSLSGVFGG